MRRHRVRRLCQAHGITSKRRKRYVRTRGSYKRKRKLLEVANKVAKLSRQYQRQLEVCGADG